MKTPRYLRLVAIAAFIVSYFLPAFEDMSGLACFGYCWNVLVGREGDDILTGGWFYYSGFVISSVLFIALLVALFVTKKGCMLRSVLSAVCFLQVLSWLVLAAMSGEPSSLAAIKSGYYVWLVAYGLLVAAHLWKRTPSEQGAPASRRPAGLPGGSGRLPADVPTDRPFPATAVGPSA